MQRRSALRWLCMCALVPNAAWSQRTEKVYRLGILANRDSPYLTEPLFAALSGRGWVVGQNVLVESRITGGDYRRAPDLARELIGKRVDILVVLTTGNAVAARQVTSTLPIVMLGSGYPVEAGLARSLARPGGNVTGVSVYAGTEIWGKYVALAQEVVPSMRELGVLFDYVVSGAELGPALSELRKASLATNVALRFLRHQDESDLGASLAAIAKAPVDVILVTGGPIHAQPKNVALINEFALRHQIPMVNDNAAAVFLGGGLLAYSFTAREIADRCASMIDRILRGAHPGELPIEYPTKFELTINMKTARRLRLTLPNTLLARADRVIE